MKRALLTTLFLLALASLTIGTVWATSAHFTKGPTATLDTSDGDLNVCFKEAGLGSTAVTYSLTANTANFTYQCYTKSDNTPQGDPNSVSISNDANFVTLTPHNGQITGCISLSPKQDGASCQGHGLVLKLISVEYQNVTFKDVTNNVVVNLSSFGPTTIQ